MIKEGGYGADEGADEHVTARTPRGKGAVNTTDPISVALRNMLESVAAEPVPDSFLALLDQLDDAVSASSQEQEEKDKP